jgi:deoxyhypusine synthase
MTVRHMVEKVYANGSYQGRNLYKAARLWTDSAEKGNYNWLGISGAATPAGLGGIFAQAIRSGHVDAVCSTGANVYHDMHFACGLPVRQGMPKMNDEDAAKHGTTRIYDTNIHNWYTLCMQDTILQKFMPKVAERLQGEKAFSSATFLNALGKALLEDSTGIVQDKQGSMLIAAAECDAPIYLDSQHNHSLGMGLALWEADGNQLYLSPPRDINEATAFIMQMQPQFNIFCGEGGPRNFIQTLAPTASEIYYIDFEGSEGGGIKLSVALEQLGALSGSTFEEAHTWGKYPDASMTDKSDVFSEYTITFPLAYTYVLEKAGKRELKRIFQKRDEYYDRFTEMIRANKEARLKGHQELLAELPAVQAEELRARRQAFENKS